MPNVAILYYRIFPRLWYKMIRMISQKIFRILAGLILASTIEAANIDVKKWAAKVDSLVEKKLEATGRKLNPKTTDEIFLRRSYLSIIGRIPTKNEAEAFLDSKDASKRKTLIAKLLRSPGYVKHELNYITDLLRANSGINGFGNTYIDWIRKSIKKGKPYDEFVREMLSAEGALWEEGGGPLGYYFRDRYMPLDSMANTVRIFLGTRVACAQCHDHPFDKWKQRDFFELVAFSGGIDYQSKAGKGAYKYKGAEKLSLDDKTINKQMTQVIQKVLGYGIIGSGNGSWSLPHDYQYDDAKPMDFVFAKTPFGGSVSIEPKKIEGKFKKVNKKQAAKRQTGLIRYQNIGARKVFANWLTSSENPRFTLVIANRLWKRVMGMGVIEPVDDFRDDSVASDPELLALLEKIMKEARYDFRSFYSVLYNTKLFESESPKSDLEYSKNLTFSGPLARRFTAEQIWDSIITLSKGNPDGEILRFPTYSPKQYEVLSLMDAKEMSDLMMSINKTVKKMDYASYKQKKKFDWKLIAMSKKAKTIFTEKTGGITQDEMKELRREYKNLHAGKSLASERASDMGMPAKPGHFLYQFGQSGKRQIEGGHTQASVPQALNLMNGAVRKFLSSKRKKNEIWKNINEATTKRDKIQVEYLSVLGRRAKSSEIVYWMNYIESVDEEEAFEDILWTLVNSREFMFIL